MREGGEQLCGAQVGVQPERRADLQKSRLGAEVPRKVVDARVVHRAADRAQKHAVGGEAAVDRVLREGLSRLFDGAHAH